MKLIKQNQIHFNFLKYIKFNSLKKIFFLISLTYFFVYFFQNFGQIKFDIDLQRNANSLFLSFIFCLLSIYFNAFAWKNIIIWFGKKNINNNLVSFYVLTNILKYVPGGIWHFVERFNFIKDISNSNFAFYSILIEPYFMLCAAFFLALTGIVFSPFYLLLAVPLFFLNRKLIYLVLPRLESLKGKVAEVLKIKKTKNQFENSINLTTFFPTKAFLFEIGFVLAKFIGFFICFNLVTPDSNVDILFLFVIFCFSWSIGLVVPTAPSGVGVFEACFLFLIGRTIPQNIIILCLIYFRLISTSADLFLSAPFLLRKLLKKT